MKFSDVGGKFINKEESLKRIKKLTHRSALKSRRRAVLGGEREQAILEAKEAKRVERETARKEKKAASEAFKAVQEEKSKAMNSAARNLLFE